MNPSEKGWDKSQETSKTGQSKKANIQSKERSQKNRMKIQIKSQRKLTKKPDEPPDEPPKINCNRTLVKSETKLDLAGF